MSKPRVERTCGRCDRMAQSPRQARLALVDGTCDRTLIAVWKTDRPHYNDCFTPIGGRKRRAK